MFGSSRGLVSQRGPQRAATAEFALQARICRHKLRGNMGVNCAVYALICSGYRAIMRAWWCSSNITPRVFAMFPQVNRVKSGAKTYEYLRIVESYRDQKGRCKHRIIAN